MTESKNFKWMDKPTEFEWTPEALVDWAIFHEKNQGNSMKLWGKDLLEEFKNEYNKKPKAIFPEGIVAFEIGNRFDEQVLDYQDWCYLHTYATSPAHQIKTVKNSEGEFSVGENFTTVEKNIYEVERFQIREDGKKILAKIKNKTGFADIATMRKVSVEKPATVYPEGIVGFKLNSKFNSTIFTQEAHNHTLVMQGHQPGDYQNFCSCYFTVQNLSEIWTVKNSEGEFSVGDKCGITIPDNNMVATILAFDLWENMIWAATDKFGKILLSHIAKPEAEVSNTATDTKVKEIVNYLKNTIKALTQLNSPIK